MQRLSIPPEVLVKTTRNTACGLDAQIGTHLVEVSYDGRSQVFHYTRGRGLGSQPSRSAVLKALLTEALAAQVNPDGAPLPRPLPQTANLAQMRRNATALRWVLSERVFDRLLDTIANNLLEAEGVTT